MEDTNEEKKAGCQEKSYANLLCDFMFKRMFCSEANKDVLIWFLNMVLEDVEIKSVDFIPTEHLGLTEEDRKVIFDISCECTDGRTFIIEMQKGYQKYFRERALYYTTYPINAQGRKARDLYDSKRIEGKTQERFAWDYNLKPVIVVALLNFEFKHSEDWPKEKYLSSYRLLEDTVNEPMTQALRFVFLELGRFNKQIFDLEIDEHVDARIERNCSITVNFIFVGQREKDKHSVVALKVVRQEFLVRKRPVAYLALSPVLEISDERPVVFAVSAEITGLNAFNRPELVKSDLDSFFL